MFPTRLKAENPEVIMPEKKASGSSLVSYEHVRLSGIFFRVSPQSNREILAIQMLEHHREKFAPAHGDGVIVTFEALQKFH